MGRGISLAGGVMLYAGAAAAQTPCATLGDFKPSIDAVITAEQIDASAMAPWTAPGTSLTQFTGAATAVVPFCRVTGSLKPTPQSDIRFELWLPPRNAWNGNFFGTASGGSAGAINYPVMIDPLTRGYAAMGHDNGHVSSGFDQSWVRSADGRLLTEKLVDFASRAQHVATVVGKEIAASFYNGAPKRAYYAGCSQGGHHGMMEAQRFPDDYDGIVAGAHSGDWIGVLASEAWASTQVLKDNRAGGLSPAKLTLLSKAVLKTCDAADGLEDGQIADPRQCAFNPAVLQCRAGMSTGECLTSQQVAATAAIYNGPEGASGYARGSEANWITTWNANTRLQSGSYHDFFRLVLKQDPAWDFLTLEWPRDIDEARAKFGGIYNAVNPDLSAFKARGGKLIMYHGWSDALVPAGTTVAAWNRMTSKMGAESLGQFARLFMVPGMGHCAGGPIGNADWLTALERWVERGLPPDATPGTYTLLGSGKIGGVARTRPYCPYPKVARYRGAGDINTPESFICAAS